MELLFWLSAAVLFYSLAGYGLLLLLFARLRPARTLPTTASLPDVTFIIAAYNEATVIEDKLRNTLALETGDASVEVIVISDGSSDDTVACAHRVADPRVTVIDADRMGKAAALGLGLERATGDVVVFSDANAMLVDGTLVALLRHFADPEIGGVCGQISVDTGSAGGIGSSEGLYWRYDQAMKQAETRLGGAVSAQGSVYALRRRLARTPPPGCTDDFMISVGAVAAGYKLVFEPEACTTEVVTEKVGSEMRRRVRSSERGWRSMMHHARLMNPFRTGWYAWQLVSHKFIRRLNPLFLVLLFLSNLALIGQGWFYTLAGAAQIGFYAIGSAALAVPKLRGFKPAGMAAFFILAHAALVVGFFRYARGRESVIWTPSRESD